MTRSVARSLCDSWASCCVLCLLVFSLGCIREWDRLLLLVSDMIYYMSTETYNSLAHLATAPSWVCCKEKNCERCMWWFSYEESSNAATKQSDWTDDTRAVNWFKWWSRFSDWRWIQLSQRQPVVPCRAVSCRQQMTDSWSFLASRPSSTVSPSLMNGDHQLIVESTVICRRLAVVL